MRMQSAVQGLVCLLPFVLGATSGCDQPQQQSSNVTARLGSPPGSLERGVVGHVVIFPVRLDKENSRITIRTKLDRCRGNWFVWWIRTSENSRVVGLFGGGRGSGLSKITTGTEDWTFPIAESDSFFEKYPWHAGTIRYAIERFGNEVVLSRLPILQDEGPVQAEFVLQILESKPDLREGQIFREIPVSYR